MLKGLPDNQHGSTLVGAALGSELSVTRCMQAGTRDPLQVLKERHSPPDVLGCPREGEELKASGLFSNPESPEYIGLN